jgi:hypothetical protein
LDIPPDNVEEFEARERLEVTFAITITEQICCLIGRSLAFTIVHNQPSHFKPDEIRDVGLGYDTPKLCFVTIDAETRNGPVHPDAATLLRKQLELTDRTAIIGGDRVHSPSLSAGAAADRIYAIGKHDVRDARCTSMKLRRRQALNAPQDEKNCRYGKDCPNDEVTHLSPSFLSRKFFLEGRVDPVPPPHCGPYLRQQGRDCQGEPGVGRQRRITYPQRVLAYVSPHPVGTPLTAGGGGVRGYDGVAVRRSSGTLRS